MKFGENFRHPWILKDHLPPLEAPAIKDKHLS